MYKSKAARGESLHAVFCRVQREGIQLDRLRHSTARRHLSARILPETGRKKRHFRHDELAFALPRIHRGRVSGQCPEAANGRSSESGIMVL